MTRRGAADDDGATPLSPDDRAGLRLRHVATRGELNEAEQANILAAIRWTAARQPRDLLTIGFARRLHKRMFGQVWNWAGEFSRERRRRIGLDAAEIAPALQMLFDDAGYWIAHDSFAPDTIAVRFH